MSLSHNQTEVILACTTGTIYRCMIGELQYVPVGVSHTSEISCVCFGSQSPSIFSTGTKYVFSMS